MQQDLDITIKTNIKGTDFRLQYMTVADLADRFQSKFPQRSRKRLCTQEKARYIESIFIGIPQEPMFVDYSDEKPIFIKGEDRVKALVDFVKNGMVLTHTYFRPYIYENKCIDGLSLSTVQSFLDTKIPMYILNPGSSSFVRYGTYLSFQPKLNYSKKAAIRECLFPHYREIRNFSSDFIAINRCPVNKAVFEDVVCSSFLAHLLCSDYDKRYLRLHTDILENAVLQTDNFVKIFEGIKVEGELSKLLSLVFTVKTDRLFYYAALGVCIIRQTQNMPYISIKDMLRKFASTSDIDAEGTSLESYRKRIIGLSPDLSNLI